MIYLDDPTKQKIVSQFIALLDSDYLLGIDYTEFDSVKFCHNGETYYFCMDLKIEDKKEYFGEDSEE